MNEVQAAFGLLQLKYVDSAITRRQKIDAYYREALANVAGINVYCHPLSTRHNYSYFPILVEQDYPLSRDGLYDLLKTNDVFARRYFYPLISEFPMYRSMPSAARSNLAVAHQVASKVICLPIYPDLPMLDVERTIGLIAGVRSSCSIV